ncbi:MAG: nucleotidyltransferase domain-containing protein [Anaerolineae bacterium]|nr:nucleotidyltransferase domain-containing protein [Anaerolineae bacterium]
MLAAIKAHLEKIELEDNVRIFYACESGSRAWGFPSADSDYDVRFLYLRPIEWYLSIDLEHKRDVIERSIEANLDINGWDLRKALQLFRKSNPPLMEWLGSPIIYQEHGSITAKLRVLAKQYYAAIPSSYHYLSMAHNNIRGHFDGPTVKLKKYFYILRPLLAILWIEQGLGVVPTEFQVLVNHVVDSPELKAEIDQLIRLKRQHTELSHGPRIEPISAFIQEQITRLDSKRFENEYTPPDIALDDLNPLFRASLDEIWR